MAARAASQATVLTVSLALDVQRRGQRIEQFWRETLRYRKNHAYLYDSLDDTREDEEGDYFPKDYSDWRPIPSEALATKELREALNKAIAGLAPKYREVLLLRDVQQMNIAETAKALNISEQNVRTRLLRARLMVRDVLAPGYDGMWASGREYQKIRPW